MQSFNEGVYRSPGLSDWVHCEEIARHHGRSFYLASRLLPPARQRGVISTYAHCRVADDIVDRASGEGPTATAEVLARWARQLTSPDEPVAVAFAHTRERYGIPMQPVSDLLSGIQTDLTVTRYANWEELRRYCYHVAGTVGLMVAPILGCRDSKALRHAADLGIAMQLTNILRDVAEDAQMGRIYLPVDEIEAFGCDPDAILAGQPGGRFSELMAFQIDRARSLYASALRGVYALSPSGRFTTLAATKLYSGILGEIEALDYDVYRMRAHVPTARKLRSMAGASTDFLRMSMMFRDQTATVNVLPDADALYVSGRGQQAGADAGRT
jgi:phytoene synthase